MNGLMRFFFVAVLCSVAALSGRLPRPNRCRLCGKIIRRPHRSTLQNSPRFRVGCARNIILIIGDVMGQGAINFASLHAHGAPGRLSFEQFPVRGLRVPARQTAGSPIPLPPVPHSPAAGRPATAWSA